MGSSESLTVRDLRRLWKPHKERFVEQKSNEDLRVRLHRCFSWLDRVERMGDGGDDDATLIFQWIALNSLYGRWNDERREPAPDVECWRRFLDRLLDLDEEARLASLLEAERPLVMAILEDAYLSSFFWQDPTERQARKAQKPKFDARTWYLEKRWGLILARVMERVYLLRCQLVHGAATQGGKLNRASLCSCTQFLNKLMPALLLVMIDHGHTEDWGLMCYPPLTELPRV